jgi:hypothetical protein
VNKCLLSMVNKINEKMYCEYSIIISNFLKTSLQESLGPLLDKILKIFFCRINNLLTFVEFPPKNYAVT